MRSVAAGSGCSRAGGCHASVRYSCPSGSARSMASRSSSAPRALRRPWEAVGCSSRPPGGFAGAIVPRSSGWNVSGRPTRSIACARPSRSSASRRGRSVGSPRWSECLSRPSRRASRRFPTPMPLVDLPIGPRRIGPRPRGDRGRARGSRPPSPRPAACSPPTPIGHPTRPPRRRTARPLRRRPGARASSSVSRTRAVSWPTPAAWPSGDTRPGSARASGGSSRSWPTRSGPGASRRPTPRTRRIRR